MPCFIVVSQFVAVSASSIVLTVGRLKIQTMIKYTFYFLKTNIKKKCDSMLGTLLHWIQQLQCWVWIQCWVAEFKIGWTSTTDEPHSGHSFEVTTLEINRKNLQNRFGEQ